MRLHDLPSYTRDTVLRMLPHRAPTGLVRVGSPGRSSPVLLTCNFTLTVRRLREVLRGQHAWLLVANSRGINVWCAAGGGHLTHHDVIAVLRTSGIGELVDHRELVLPQLAATGVERRPVEEATGWTGRWGPARLEDLPAYLDRGSRATSRQRVVRFPLWERLEMAATWAVPMAVIGAPLAGLAAGWQAGVAAAVLVVLTVAATFAALPRLRISGRGRWLTHGGLAVVGAGVGSAVLTALESADPYRVAVVGTVALLGSAVLSIDLAGTTPTHPSSVGPFGRSFAIDLVAERCTGAADCIQVCPRGVLHLDGALHQVRIEHPDACIRCGACVVQCPEDALRFRAHDGRVVEAATVRQTRLNLLGERAVNVK